MNQTSTKKTIKATLPPIRHSLLNTSLKKIPRLTLKSAYALRNTRSLENFSEKVACIHMKKKVKPKISIKPEDIVYEKLIAEGKNSSVFIGTIADKRYAVKIASRELKNYIENEHRILSMFSNPHIVKCIEKIESQENIFLILELVPGIDLFQHIKIKRLKLWEIKKTTQQIIKTLEMIHGNGIVYRDLKPENLIITETGEIVFIDFGLCKVINDDKTRTLCGSVEYMAPEIIKGEAYSYPVDFWALGILVYELFTG